MNLQQMKGEKSNALEAQVEDAASNIYGHSSPMEQMDEGEESPLQVPNDNVVETEAAGENELNQEENERVEEQEPHTTELPEGYYEVEAIRAKRVQKGQKQYLIKWLGWPEETNTWEPLRHLSLVRDMIDDFEKSLKSRKQCKQKLKQTVHSTTSKATKRRNSSFVRESHVCNAADSERITNIPAVEPIEEHSSNAIDSQMITNIAVATVEQTDAIAAGNAGNTDHSNHVEEVMENHHIVRIVKPDGYRPPQSDTDDPTLRFSALRADGVVVVVDNHFLKENNPQLLLASQITPASFSFRYAELLTPSNWDLTFEKSRIRAPTSS
ncbi:hypothetical protein L6164_002781 [Bauhinia variegata]|uniref:Uncharacterized protein n=1 Tax=Bauhinia variegata TaxID=167791 RepID=A0ACB9PZ93_BAUVA|nr:hypothetical protein L6164_002781 [Bauhinia variegata]